MDRNGGIVLNNQMAKYAKFHMTYNDLALVLEITPLNIQHITEALFGRMLEQGACQFSSCTQEQGAGSKPYEKECGTDNKEQEMRNLKEQGAKGEIVNGSRSIDPTNRASSIRG